MGKAGQHGLESVEVERDMVFQEIVGRRTANR